MPKPSFPSLARSRLPSSIPFAPSRDLVGPPCPLSNLRPVYYAPLFPDLHSSPDRLRTTHPYSLKEFPSEKEFLRSRGGRRKTRLQEVKEQLNEEDLKWRLARYRFDAFNQDFWARTNRQFLLSRERYISHQLSLPANSHLTPDEINLDGFYRSHLDATKKVYAKYNRELWARQFGLVWPSLKAMGRGWRWKWEKVRAGIVEKGGD